jgi:protein transport protein SEC24
MQPNGASSTAPPPQQQYAPPPQQQYAQPQPQQHAPPPGARPGVPPIPRPAAQPQARPGSLPMQQPPQRLQAPLAQQMQQMQLQPPSQQQMQRPRQMQTPPQQMQPPQQQQLAPLLGQGPMPYQQRTQQQYAARPGATGPPQQQPQAYAARPGPSSSMQNRVPPLPQQQQPLYPAQPGLPGPPGPPPVNGHANGHAQAQAQALPPSAPPSESQQQVPPPGPARPSMRPQPVQNMRPMPGGLAPSSMGPPSHGSAYAPGYANGVSQQQAPAAAPAPAAKLNPQMMPRPCAQEKEVGTPRDFHHRGLAASTNQNGSIYGSPPTNSDFISIDDGSARVRFMRMTTGAIAAEPGVMSKCGVPLAAVLSPFADSAPGEAGIAVVDLQTACGGGPLRCERCNAYANPGFKFINGGSQFNCNLCTHLNTTPTYHFSPIAPATGLRMDANIRHEFRFGSVDYLVGSSDYCMRPPKAAAYVFAIDISATAVASGLALSAIGSIKAAIGAGMLPGSNAGARVGILTFDRSLHYYDARGADDSRSVSMHIVPDVAEAFIPIGGEAFFLKPTEAVAALDSILEVHKLAAGAAQAQQQQERIGASDSALGAALIAIKTALAPCGGKAFIVASTLPTFGPGKLERRGGAIGGGEEREMGLLRAAIPDFEVIGCELADVQISVDLFLAPSSSYVDAATLVRVPRACGGRLFMFSDFNPMRDSASLHRSLCSAVGTVRAFEALLRVRTSVGLETTGEFIGHFGRPQRGEDVSGPVFDASSSLALELSVVSKLIDDKKGNDGGYANASSMLYNDACVQAAILYTDPAGNRRIRVHTMFANKTTVLADVFKYADVDATCVYFAKRAATAVLAGGSPLSKAREALTEKMTQSLFVYRKHCTSAPLSGQLILPEALKVLPVMILGLTKSAAFRPTAVSAQSSDAVSLDERVAALAFLTWAAPADIVAMAYPRLWALHRLDKRAGVPLPAPENPVMSGNNLNGAATPQIPEPLAMPNTVALCSDALEEEGVLLAENGMHMVLWVGTRADPTLVNDVIAQTGSGLLAIRAETAGSNLLIKDVGEAGKRIASVISRIVTQRTALSHPQVVIRQQPGAGGESKFLMPLLIEDRPANGGHSYVEFLRHIHKRVMDKLENDNAQADIQTWELLNNAY